MDWNEAKKHEIFSVVTGSNLYGTAHPGSDWDVRSVYIDKPMPDGTPNKKNPDGSDDAMIEVREFVSGLVNGDNQKIEMLFAPSANIQVLDKHSVYPLLAIRNTFLSNAWQKKTLGYAKALIYQLDRQLKPVEDHYRDISHVVRVLHKLGRYAILLKGFTPVLDNKSVIDLIVRLKTKTASQDDFALAVAYIRRMTPWLLNLKPLPSVDMALVQQALYSILSEYWSNTLGPISCADPCSQANYDYPGYPWE